MCSIFAKNYTPPVPDAVKEGEGEDDEKTEYTKNPIHEKTNVRSVNDISQI